MTTPLDRIDRRILRELQANARLGNAELARRVALSPAACHRRVQRLFAESYITGTSAFIDPAKVDLGILAIIGVVLDRSTPDSFAAFDAAVSELSFVLECYMVAGDFDYFVKVRVKDIDDFYRLHGERLIAIPGVRQTRTFFVMKSVRENGPLEF
jgi:Lrp/AsnC family leucine-responsive transcriptional regulator